MNTINATVTAVLSKPREMYGQWFVDVRADSHGREGEIILMFPTLEKAKKLKAGDRVEI